MPADDDKYIIMQQCSDLTHYLNQHLQSNAGASYRHPIKIRQDDADDYVALECQIIKSIAKALKFRYVVLEQTLCFSRTHRAYDIIMIEKGDGTVQKLWFEITEVFGKFK